MNQVAEDGLIFERRTFTDEEEPKIDSLHGKFLYGQPETHVMEKQAVAKPQKAAVSIRKQKGGKRPDGVPMLESIRA